MNGDALPERAASSRAQSTRRLARMVLRWGSMVLAAILVLFAGLLTFRDVVFRMVLAQRLRQEFGVRVEIGELKTGLSSTIVQVRDFKVFNSPEFGGSLLAEVPELFARFDTDSLSDHLVRLQELRVNLAEFNVVRNDDGRTNLDKMEKVWREHVRRKRLKKDRTRWDFGGIDRLEVSLGKIAFTDLHHPSLNREIHLDLHKEKASDLKDEEHVQGWAGLLALRLLAQDAMRPPAERKLPTHEWLLGWSAK